MKKMVKHKALKYEVEVLDRKVAYGRELSLVKPVAGSGQMWIRSESLK